MTIYHLKDCDHWIDTDLFETSQDVADSIREVNKKINAGMPGEGKLRSIRFALQMFPGIELTPQRCRKPKDGRADAACLAYWGTVA